MKKMSSTEKTFYDHMKRRGHDLIYEPKKFDLFIPRPKASGNKTYTPDFCDVKTDTYYEVIWNLAYYKTIKNKLTIFKNCYPSVKFKVVYPDGDRVEDDN